MTPTPHRTRSILAAVARAYPSAWQDLDGFRALRGCPDFINWPDWCFVPASGAYAVVSGGGGQRVRFEQSGHVGLVAGLGAWRITQGVYRFDSTLYEALLATPITDEIPVDVLHRLPGGVRLHRNARVRHVRCPPVWLFRIHGSRCAVWH